MKKEILYSVIISFFIVAIDPYKIASPEWLKYALIRVAFIGLMAGIISKSDFKENFKKSYNKYRK